MERNPASDPILSLRNTNTRVKEFNERVEKEDFWTSNHQQRETSFRESIGSKPTAMVTSSEWDRRILPTNVNDVLPTRINNNSLRTPHDSVIYSGFIDNTGRYEPGVLNSNWNEERWDVTHRPKQGAPAFSDISHLYTTNYSASFNGRDPLGNFKPSSNSLTPPPEPKPVRLPSLPDMSKKNPISEYHSKPDEPYTSTFRGTMPHPKQQTPPFGIRTTYLTRDEEKLNEYRERWTSGSGRLAETEYMRLQASRGKSPASERRNFTSKV